jgi:hypothetical protein
MLATGGWRQKEKNEREVVHSGSSRLDAHMCGGCGSFKLFLTRNEGKNNPPFTYVASRAPTPVDITASRAQGMGGYRNVHL